MKFAEVAALILDQKVAPLAGARIEIFVMLLPIDSIVSLPSRERGLKLNMIWKVLLRSTSLPSRERGLK